MNHHLTNENAPGNHAESAEKISTKHHNRNIKSTATHAQHLRVYELLKSGDKSTLELRRNGVMAPAPRTKEMREKYDIPVHRTRRQDIYDEQGYKHPRVAFYGITDIQDAAQKMTQFEVTHG